jgi:hypothetical protein
MLTKDDLTALATHDAAPVVSIYMPTHERGREVRQDPIRFKNALAAAMEQLIQTGLRAAEVEELLAPGRRLLEDDLFWRHQAAGLAVVMAPGLFQQHRLPVPVAEAVIVGRQPHIKPLLPMLADDGRFYCLAAQAGDTRLYEGSRFAMSEVEIDMPRSVAEISAETDYQNTRHAAPPARPRSAGPVGMPSTHNFGEDPEEQRKAQLIEHVRRVHNALERHLAGDQTPIVLVAADELQGHYRALGTKIGFIEGGVRTDPAAHDAAALHKMAYELVQPLFAQRREQAVERFEALAGAGDARGAERIEEIVRAAVAGRVDTLLIQEGQAVWGHYVADADRVEKTAEPAPDRVDLVDLAAARTLLNGGHVHVLPQGAMPRPQPMLASLRY